MDENFLKELVAEGEKKFSFEVPLTMSFGDALNNLKGTVEEVIKASDGWKDEKGLRMEIAMEAEGWKAIFAKAYEVSARSTQALVNTLEDDDNAGKIIGLAKSGNQAMKHFHVFGEQSANALKMYFVFVMAAGPKIISSIDFG
jgi:hypothetical protein